MIRVDNLKYCYPGSHSLHALRGVSFTMDTGEKVALMGANGSGKTTFVRCLNGLLRPISGDVLIDGLSVYDPKAIYEIRRRVGMVFQNPDNQIVSATVEREIIFGLENLGLSWQDMNKRLGEVLQKFHLETYRGTPPYMLSGGERQRLALASVWAMDPCYLILDEPTALLHPQGRQEVLRYLDDELEKEKIGILLVTQSPEEAMACNRLIVMDGGEILFDDLPEQVFIKLSKKQKRRIAIPAWIELKKLLDNFGYEYSG